MNEAFNEYELLFNSLLSPVVIIQEASGKILNLNRSATTMLGDLKDHNYNIIFGNQNLLSFENDNTITKFDTTIKIKDEIFIPARIFAVKIKIKDTQYIVLEISDIRDEQNTQELLSERVEYEKAVLEISTLLMDISVFETNIQTVLDHISTITVSDRVSIYTVDRNNMMIHLKYEWNLFNSMKVKSYKRKIDLKDLEIWCSNLLENDIIYLDDLNLLPESLEIEKTFLQKNGINASVFVPMFNEKKIIGFISIDYIHEPFNKSPNILEFIKIVTNIVEDALIRKKEYDKLKENIKFLNILINTIPEPVFYKDKSGNYMVCNKIFSDKIIGLPSDCIIGRNQTSLLNDDMLKIETETDSQTISSGTYIYESNIVCSDNKERDFVIHKSTFINPSNMVAGVVGIMIDITEKNKKSQELTNFLKAVSQSANLIIVTDNTWCIEFVNLAFSKITGYTSEEVVGTILNLENTEQIKQIKEQIANNVEWRGEIIEKRKNKEVFIGKAIITPVLNNKMELKNILIVAEDISIEREREIIHQRLQKELADADKMLAVGQLAAGVAHEFNNILAVIKSTAQIIQLSHSMGEYALPDSVITDIKSIDDCTKRAADIANNLMIISKPVEPIKELCQIQDIVNNVIKIQKNQFQMEGITISHDYKPVSSVFIDSGQMQQVFLNLSINARHALRNREIKNIAIKIYEKDHDVTVAFTDTGCGIPENIIDKIFLPFFTTKGASSKNALEPKGTGLGLSVTKSVIINNNGKIDVESKPDKGTTFYITLPAINEQIGKQMDTKVFSALYDRGGFFGNLNIAGIDHDINILQSMKRILGELGYKSIDIFNNSSDFIVSYRENKYDLIIIDNKIINENTLYDFITNTDKQVNFIILSSDGDINDSRKNIIEYIKKPFDIFDLLTIVDKYSLKYKK